VNDTAPTRKTEVEAGFGSDANWFLGNAVRSRIAQMISKSASALAAACSEAKG